MPWSRTSNRQEITPQETQVSQGWAFPSVPAALSHWLETGMVSNGCHSPYPGPQSSTSWCPEVPLSEDVGWNTAPFAGVDLGSQPIPIFSLLHSKLSLALAIPSSEVWWCDQNHHPKGVWILTIHTLSSLGCWMYQVWWGKEGCIRTYPSGSPGFHTHASLLSSCKGSPTPSCCSESVILATMTHKMTH